MNANTMCQENAHHTLKDMYKQKAHHMLKDMYNGKAHQTSSPTILSTAVKAIRGAVVAAGVCVHNTAFSTEGTRLSMTTTTECCWGLDTQQLSVTGDWIHNTAFTTECTTAFMTPKGECEYEYECEHECMC